MCMGRSFDGVARFTVDEAANDVGKEDEGTETDAVFKASAFYIPTSYIDRASFSRFIGA